MAVKFLREYYIKNRFEPSGLFGLISNPFYLTRSSLCQKLTALKSHTMDTRLLDVGCGSKPYKNILCAKEHVGIDVQVSGHNHELSEVDIYYDGKVFPFDDNTFDVVLLSEVLEHLFEPNQILGEIYRVLKPGGKLILTCPFAWNEHEVPFDFARYTSFGLDKILTNNRFEVISSEKTGSFILALTQLSALYVHLHILPSKRVLKILLNPLFVAPITCAGIILDKILPSKDDFFLNNVVLCKKIT